MKSLSITKNELQSKLNSSSGTFITIANFQKAQDGCEIGDGTEPSNFPIYFDYENNKYYVKVDDYNEEGKIELLGPFKDLGKTMKALCNDLKD